MSCDHKNGGTHFEDGKRYVKCADCGAKVDASDIRAVRAFMSGGKEGEGGVSDDIETSDSERNILRERNRTELAKIDAWKRRMLTLLGKKELGAMNVVTTGDVEKATLVQFARWVKDDPRITEAWIAIATYEPRADEYVNPDELAAKRFVGRLYVAGMTRKQDFSEVYTPMPLETEPFKLCEGGACENEDLAREALRAAIKERLLARHATIQCALDWLHRVGT